MYPNYYHFVAVAVLQSMLEEPKPWTWYASMGCLVLAAAALAWALWLVIKRKGE